MPGRASVLLDVPRGGRALREALDHPITFVFFMTITVFATAAILRWGFKAANMPGPASIFGG